MRRAVFLDRDGVVNRNRPDHVKSVEELAILPNAFQALHRLGGSGLAVVVVSNQAAVNRGLVSRETVQEINRQLVEEVRLSGGRIDAVYFCPHRPDEGCDCRKPRPGLLRTAASELNIDLAASFLVGDAVTDVQAALEVGAQPLLVLTGRGREQAPRLTGPDLGRVPVLEDLLQAVEWILKREQRQ